MTNPLRGEIYWVDWNPGRGSEQTGRRPALIVQNDLANQNARFGTTVVLAITTKGYFLPTGRLVRHMVEVPPTDATGLSQTSFVKTDQIVTIAKDRLEKRIGALPPEMLSEVESALKRHLSLT